MPDRRSPASDRSHADERRSQIRGLLLLAAVALAFALVRAGAGRGFTPGWWRLW